MKDTIILTLIFLIHSSFTVAPTKAQWADHWRGATPDTPNYMYTMPDRTMKVGSMSSVRMNSNQINYMGDSVQAMVNRMGYVLKTDVRDSVRAGISAGTNITILNGQISSTPTTYTGGTGINVSGTTIINTAPDQAITLSMGIGIKITGTYPIFTISNSDYYNSTTTVGDSAVFWLTNDKTSTGTALYSTVHDVSPKVNDKTGIYTFDWNISADKKKLVIRGRVAINTGVIALLGLILTGGTIPVTTGLPVYVTCKGS